MLPEVAEREKLSRRADRRQIVRGARVRHLLDAEREQEGARIRASGSARYSRCRAISTYSSQPGITHSAPGGRSPRPVQTAAARSPVLSSNDIARALRLV